MIALPIRYNKRFFFFLWLFGCICIIAEPWNGSRLLALLELPFDIYLLCALLMLFREKTRMYIKIILSGLLYIIGFADMWCYQRLHMPITSSLLNIVLQTNSQESQEAISSYWNCSILLSPLSLLLIVSLLHSFLSFSYKKYHFNNNSSRFQIYKILIPILIISFVVSLPDKEHFLYTHILKLNDEDKQQKELFFNIETRANIYLPVYRLFVAVNDIMNYKDVIDRLQQTAEQTTVDTCAFTSPNLVLIIGESYNRHHSQLYGYQKETTPYQYARMKKGEIKVFSDVISAWNLTYMSFQDMFSLKTQLNKGGWYDYPLFTTIFKLSGYDVQFLSNQYALSLEGSFSDFVEDMFINNPKMSSLQFTHRNTTTHQYDEQLLADYDSLDNNNSSKLIIFHFLGLHADFHQRYPENYIHFTADNYKRDDLSAEDRQLIAYYDNAMRYNDKVIESILQRMEQKESIVVCLADHGERIFDYDTNTFGRSMAMTYESIHQQYDIPFWIWYSDIYREKHPDIANSISSSVHKPWTTANLSHLMLFLGGIKNQFYCKEANILTPDYKPKKRMIGGKYPYNK